jgi:hypothetical protein
MLHDGRQTTQLLTELRLRNDRRFTQCFSKPGAGISERLQRCSTFQKASAAIHKLRTYVASALNNQTVVDFAILKISR